MKHFKFYFNDSNKRNFVNSISPSIKSIFSVLKWFDPGPTFHQNGLNAHLMMRICRLNNLNFYLISETWPINRCLRAVCNSLNSNFQVYVPSNDILPLYVPSQPSSIVSVVNIASPQRLYN